MNKETIVTSVKASMKKVTIKAKKYSPEILIVAGVDRNCSQHCFGM